MSMPLLRCREVMPYLSAYVDGELDARLRAQVETHLASCPRCSQQVARYQAIDGLLDSLPGSSPSPEVLDRILASTSSQNKEKAVRQSLRQPERALAPRSVPAFLVADTNLAAPIPSRHLRAGNRRSWLLTTGLPTLAAVLIIATSFVFFHVRTNRLSDVVTPTPVTNIEEVTQKQVDNLASQLPFTPVMPTLYPSVTALLSTSIGKFNDGTKYLDVVWNLHAPLTTLHLREVGVSLGKRYDYVPVLSNPQHTWWMLPNTSHTQWLPMGPASGSSSDIIVGASFSGFSVTLDIGARGGNPNALTPTSSSSTTAADLELTTLRLMSLSMYPGITYQALPVVFPPDSESVVHFQIHTTGVGDGKRYTWDVYLNNPRGLTRAALYDGWGTLGTPLYTDYMNNANFTRCYPNSTCVALSSAPATDPFQLGNKAHNFLLSGINSDVQDGELWNLGLRPAPSELGIGEGSVYALAFVSGPYPITVYVSKSEPNMVVGVISDTSSPAPGGPGATNPLSAPGEGSCSSGVTYPVIAYLPSNSKALPPLTAPERAARGSVAVPSIATC